MTPLPDEPVVIVYKDKNVTANASNINHLQVIICNSEEDFDKLALGKPYVVKYER